MAKNPKTPSRPRDMSQLAKRIVDITTGEEWDVEPEPTDPKAKKRGDARAAKLSPERRSEIAKKAAVARWEKEEERPPSLIQWNIKDDGTGTADVLSTVDGNEVQSKYRFDTLDKPDQIPPDLANLIRNDGRTRGSIP